MTIKQYKNIFSVVAKIILFIAFAVSATYIILNAAGYKINISNREIVQTSMIIVKAQPKGAILKLDGALQNNLTNSWRLVGLQPGIHEIAITKDGYQDWNKSVNLEPSQTAIYENVLLFLKDASVIELGEDTNTNLVSKLKQTKPDDRIIIKDSEMSFEGMLVTRLSTQISNPQVYPDDYHITFISDNFLHAIDIDGANDQKLVSMPNDAQYLFLDSGSRVLFQDGDKVKIATIR